MDLGPIGHARSPYWRRPAARAASGDGRRVGRHANVDFGEPTLQQPAPLAKQAASFPPSDLLEDCSLGEALKPAARSSSSSGVRQVEKVDWDDLFTNATKTRGFRRACEEKAAAPMAFTPSASSSKPRSFLEARPRRPASSAPSCAQKQALEEEESEILRLLGSRPPEAQVLPPPMPAAARTPPPVPVAMRAPQREEERPVAAWTSHPNGQRPGALVARREPVRESGHLVRAPARLEGTGLLLQAAKQQAAKQQAAKQARSELAALVDEAVEEQELTWGRLAWAPLQQAATPATGQLLQGRKAGELRVAEECGGREDSNFGLQCGRLLLAALDGGRVNEQEVCECAQGDAAEDTTCDSSTGASSSAVPECFDEALETEDTATSADATCSDVTLLQRAEAAVHVAAEDVLSSNSKSAPDDEEEELRESGDGDLVYSCKSSVAVTEEPMTEEALDEPRSVPSCSEDSRSEQRQQLLPSSPCSTPRQAPESLGALPKDVPVSCHGEEGSRAKLEVEQKPCQEKTPCRAFLWLKDFDGEEQSARGCQSPSNGLRKRHNKMGQPKSEGLRWLHEGGQPDAQDLPRDSADREPCPGPRKGVLVVRGLEVTSECGDLDKDSHHPSDTFYPLRGLAPELGEMLQEMEVAVAMAGANLSSGMASTHREDNLHVLPADPVVHKAAGCSALEELQEAIAEVEAPSRDQAFSGHPPPSAPARRSDSRPSSLPLFGIDAHEPSYPSTQERPAVEKVPTTPLTLPPSSPERYISESSSLHGAMGSSAQQPCERSSFQQSSRPSQSVRNAPPAAPKQEDLPESRTEALPPSGVQRRASAQEPPPRASVPRASVAMSSSSRERTMPVQASQRDYNLADCALCGRPASCLPDSCFCSSCSQRMDALKADDVPTSPRNQTTARLAASASSRASSSDSQQSWSSRSSSAGSSCSSARSPDRRQLSGCVRCGRRFLCPAGAVSNLLCPRCLA